MLISLAFILLLTPFPSLQASIGERKNSTKPTPHTINLNVSPKPETSLNSKAKTQSSPAAPKVSNATQASSSSSSTKPAGTANVQKAPTDKPPSGSTITVIISEGCVQKDVVNSTKLHQVELNVKSGSSLLLTHNINLDISTCTGDCEAEMEALKGRVELLEKEVFTLKKKCALCSDEECVNNCSGQGRCEGGKCVCQHSFSGPDCSKGSDKKTKLNVETVALREPESNAVRQDTPTVKKPKVEQTIFEKKVDDKEQKADKNTWTTARPSTNKPVTTTSIIKVHYNETKNRKEVQSSQTVKSQEQATRGKDKVMKVASDKQINTDSTIKLGTKQDSAEKLNTKQEKPKDTPVNQNVTQSPEKKLNGTKVLSTLVKGTKSSANVTIKTSSGKGKPSQSNVTSTENDKKLQGNVTSVSKAGSSVKPKVEKQGNVTTSIEKDKKLHQVTLLNDAATGKRKVEKHVNVSISTEKDKSQLQLNATLPKDGPSGKKKVQSYLNVTTSSEKDKKLVRSNVTLVHTGVKKKVESQANVTVSYGKDDRKKFSHGNETLKEVTSSKKKVDKQVNVTSSIEKDKKPLSVNVTLLKEETPGKKKVEKHLSVATPGEKDKMLHQGNVTVVKEGLAGKRKVEINLNATTSNEKVKKLPQSKEVTSGRKKVEKPTNVTTSIEKDKKQHQVNTTPLKEETSGRKKVEKYVNITSTIDKNKKPLQVNVTLLKDDASGKKKVTTITVSDDKNKKPTQSNSTAGLKEKVESQVNTTHSLSKDKTLRQGDDTSKKDGTKKKTVTSGSGVDVMVSTEKDKKLSNSNETASLTEVTTGQKKVEKHVNVTTVTSNKKDKKQPEVTVTAASKESIKKKVVNNVNVTVSEAKTTKLKEIKSVEVHNITATGFIITWEAPQGAFRNFTVTRREVPTGSKDEDEEAGKSQDKSNGQGTITGNEAEIQASNRTSKVQSVKVDRKSAKKFSQVLSGTARSFHFRNLQPQTRYLVSLYSSSPGGPSKLHRLFISTGPEPPTELTFSNITETSLSVSWTKPKSIVTGFRVTYTNTVNGETGSISVDSQLSHVLISKLSAGSSYEISVRSVLETMESEPTTASVVTVPNPPTDLQAVNITDSKALLTWKPSQAKLDHYILSYGSAKSPNVTVTVMLSGSSVEHQLRGLHRFTLYTVKIISQINNLQSRAISTTFTTTSGVKLQAVTPTEVTFRSAVISWKAPRLAFRSYRLTYQHQEDVKEVVLNPTVTRYELTGLVAASNYSVKVDGESEGRYIGILSTAFTTAQVPFLHPSDCSQVQQNGMKESGEAEVYPDGKDGEPVWVYCDMETDGGGWTVFQRRVDGSTDFFRGWKDYSKGFGLLSKEFWLGNDIIHSLTSLGPMSLRIDLRYGNVTAFAHYSNFTVGSEANHYTITLSGYSGTAGDSMRYHNGRPFSTKDKDPDPLSIHCAKAYLGGWWYKNCYKANLNGLYATFSENQGVVWIDWKGKDVSIPFTEMKLRPASFSHITSQD